MAFKGCMNSLKATSQLCACGACDVPMVPAVFTLVPVAIDFEVYAVAL
jgi:hypothetical protein